MKKQNGITLIALIITIIVMLILVGVTVNVALNGGLFDTAKQAASGMNMAQIEERAYMIRMALMADMESKDGIIVATQEFKNRLVSELGEKIQGNKVLVPDGKYDIIIKNTDLDIEVVEHNDYIDKYSILKQEYDVTNSEIEGRVVEASINIKLAKLNPELTRNDYIALRQQQAIDKAQNAPMDEKRAEVIEYLVNSNEMFAEDETIDDIVVSALKENFAPINHDTLEEWVADETVKTYAETNLGIAKEDLSKEHFYAYVLLNDKTGAKATEEYAVTTLYGAIIAPSASELGKEYDNATGSLTVIIKKDGENYKTMGVSNVNSDIDASFEIYENGIYEVSIGNSTSPSNLTRVEILHEKIVVNSLKELSDISGAISREEANGVWTISSTGLATYVGTEATVNTYPTYIGATKVTDISFAGNTSVKNVILPNTKTDITRTFSGCTNLTEVTIPNTATTLGQEAFKGCANLTELTIPNSITTIGEHVFEGCASLKELIIPDSVTSIGDETFYGFTGLEKITIPSSVTSIGVSAFKGCTSLTEVTIPNSVTSIGYYAFEGCTSLDNVTIPGSVSLIDSYTFNGCTGLKNITIEDGISEIGWNAFKDCKALESITLPNSVTSMRKRVMTDAGSSMTSPTYEYRSNDAFVGCTNLTNIYFAAGDNPIPNEEYKPWGAPNENLVVTKLTAES